MAANVILLDSHARVDAAWLHLKTLRLDRHRIDLEIVAAEAELDMERRRETPARTAPLLTVKQTAMRMAVSENKVWTLIRGGELAATKMGGSTRVSEDELGRYIESCGGEG